MTINLLNKNNLNKHLTKDEAFYQKSLKGTEFVMELPNNTYAYRLLTEDALDFEMDNMGHRIGLGVYGVIDGRSMFDMKFKDGSIKIYSIRDENGEPHVTFEIRENDGELYVRQCKGKYNKVPALKYTNAVKMLIKKMNWNIEGDGLYTGLLQINVKVGDDKFEKKIYSLQALIDGSEKIEKGTICNDYLDLSGLELTKLPDLSNLILTNFFNCSNNQLTDLRGAPKEVMSFNCNNNQLRSLEGAPKEVAHHFDCACNRLTSLKGAPEKVGGSFDCSRNGLISLEGAPKEVGGDFKCSNTPLTSLEGAPKEVGGHFNCSSNNLLTSLEGAPEKVGGNFDCSDNPKLRLGKKIPTKVGGKFIRDENNIVEQIKKLINKNWR